MLALQTSRHQGFKEKVCEFMLATILCNIKDHDATAIANVIENLARYFPFKQKRDEKCFDELATEKTF
jgi:hypothetical protein